MKEDTATLNQLAGAVDEARRSYSQVADETENYELKNFLVDLAVEKTSMLVDLNKAILENGGDIERDLTYKGVLYHNWLDMLEAARAYQNAKLIRGAKFAEEYLRDECAAAIERQKDSNLEQLLLACREKCAGSAEKLAELLREFEHEYEDK